MGMIEQIDDYTQDSHDAMIQMHRERLAEMGFEVTDVMRIRTAGWFWGKNYTKIYYKQREKPCK